MLNQVDPERCTVNKAFANKGAAAFGTVHRSKIVELRESKREEMRLADAFHVICNTRLHHRLRQRLEASRL